MPLTASERKERLPYGAQKELAAQLGKSGAYVSLAVKGKVRPETQRAKRELRRAQVAIARRLRVRVDDAFSPEELGDAVAA